MNFLRLLMLLGIVCLMSISCQVADSHRSKPKDFGAFALSGPDLAQTKSYQIYRSQYRLESSKIRYLINLVRYSGLSVQGGAEEVSGTLAAKQWDQETWPLAVEIRTAYDWIEQVGTKSLQTGKTYYLADAGRRLVKMKDLLLYELVQLEEHEAYLVKTGHFITRVREDN